LEIVNCLINRRLITPNLCTPRSKRVLRPVNRTPAHTGMWKSMFSAKAVPITVTNEHSKG